MNDALTLVILCKPNLGVVYIKFILSCASFDMQTYFMKASETVDWKYWKQTAFMTIILKPTEVFKIYIKTIKHEDQY